MTVGHSASTFSCSVTTGCVYLRSKSLWEVQAAERDVAFDSIGPDLGPGSIHDGSGLGQDLPCVPSSPSNSSPRPVAGSASATQVSSAASHSFVIGRHNTSPVEVRQAVSGVGGTGQRTV